MLTALASLETAMANRPALGRIDATDARAQVESVLADFAGLQIDHGQGAGFTVANQEPAGQRQLMIFVLVVLRTRERQFYQLLCFQPLGGDHDDSVVVCRVGDQPLNLAGKSGAVAD